MDMGYGIGLNFCVWHQTNNTTQAQAKLRAELESSLSLKLEAAVTNAANVGQEQVAAR